MNLNHDKPITKIVITDFETFTPNHSKLHGKLKSKTIILNEFKACGQNCAIKELK